MGFWDSPLGEVVNYLPTVFGTQINYANKQLNGANQYDAGVHGDALAAYDAYAVDQRKTILSDTSLDSTSKQELLDMLIATRSQVENTSSANSQTYQEVIADISSKIAAQKATAESEDPLYRGRRYLEEQAKLQQDQPGRTQTILTQRDTTPAGTPTLLTGAQTPVNLTAPNSLLTGT